MMVSFGLRLTYHNHRGLVSKGLAPVMVNSLDENVWDLVKLGSKALLKQEYRSRVPPDSVGHGDDPVFGFEGIACSAVRCVKRSGRTFFS